VNRVEGEAPEQERPVLSVNQAEANTLGGGEPVLAVDPTLPDQSLLDQRQPTTQEITVLDEAPATEPEPSKGKEVAPVRKWGLQFRGRVGIALMTTSSSATPIQ
jgi:hypothetical protein